MPRQYLVGNTQDEIFSDYELIQEARIKKLSFQINDRSDGSAMLVVVTCQMPRVFWKIVGILGLRRLNTLQARLFSSQDGFVIQRIVISNWKEIYWEGMKCQLLNDFRDIILMNHPLPLGWDKNIMAKSAVFYQKRIEIFVEVDNEISDKYSVLEVYLPDRIGLLYDITVQLFTFDIDITLAIINTEDGLSQDIFYIKHNNRCLDTEMTLKVLNAIQDVGNKQR